jgi:outer membrane immunogenic protein
MGSIVRFCVRGCALLSIAATVSFATLNIGLSQSALAADMPVKAPSTASTIVAPNWTGFYLNAGGGYGFWTAKSATSRAPGGPPEPALPSDQLYGGRGWLVRAGGGFDYQFNARFVAGIFADYDWSELEGTLQDAVAPHSADIKQDWSFAAGARLGWLLTPEIMTYVNGGYSRAHFTSGSMVSFATFVGNPVPPGGATGFETQAFTANGWFLGGGVETALGNGFFWRNEYRYVYYRGQNLADLNVFAPTATRRLNDISLKPEVQTFTTQIVYKLNGGAAAPGRIEAAAKAPVRWTGFHLDAGVGYGMLAADLTTNQIPVALPEANVVVDQRMGGRGWLGRFGGGYDQQFRSFVGGVFADFDYSDIRGTISDPVIPIADTIKMSWAWSVGGRVGALITRDMMGYLTGGYTGARFSAARLIDQTGGRFFGSAGGTTPAFTTNGWFVGGGTEYAVTLFNTPLFWRTEYRYAEYDSQTLDNALFGNPPTPVPVTVINSINYQPVVQTVTTQLVYKFN